MSTHTQGRLRVTHNSWEVSTLHCDGIAVARVHIDSDVDERTQQHLESVKEANARRLAACWNLCENIPTEEIEGKTLDEYVSHQAFIAGMNPSQEGMGMGIKGMAAQMLAASFAGQFIGNGATNYLELRMSHHDVGPFTVTIQRTQGLTPAQKLKQVEEQRDELRARVAELEAQLESIGAGGVGPLMQPASSKHVEQPLGMVAMPRTMVERALEHLTCDVDEPVREALRLALEQPQGDQQPRYLDGGSRYKVTHLKTSVYCIIGLPKELLGRWVALVDATDNKHMDDRQPPAVEQQQGEQEPVGEAGSMPGTDGFTMACFRASNVPVGTKLYTRPQPLQPLTDEEILRVKGQFNGTLDVQFDRFARAIERAHGIGGKA